MPTKKPNASSRILEQATRLFAARGFMGVSLQDVAKAVGIRKPSLLYHFESKEVLRRRVLEQMLERWNEVLPRLLVAATSGTEQFDAIFAETIRFFSEDPDRARLLLREVLDRPDELRPMIQQHVRPWATIVSNYIRKGQEQGRIDDSVDPEAYVLQIINLVLTGLATLDSLGVLLNEDDGESVEALRERHLLELTRVAKSSLFVEPRPSSEEGEPDSNPNQLTAAGS